MVPPVTDSADIDRTNRIVEVESRIDLITDELATLAEQKEQLVTQQRALAAEREDLNKQLAMLLNPPLSRHQQVAERRQQVVERRQQVGNADPTKTATLTPDIPAPDVPPPDQTIEV